MPDVSLLFNILARDNTAGGLNSASSRMDKFRRASSAAAIGILGAATIMGTKAVQIASDTAESASKVTTLLGDFAAGANEFAATSARTYGIAKQEALAAVGNMAAVDRAMGTSKAEASKLAVEYTKLSADLGSFNNASSSEVQEALTASLSGEYEMLKKYGIVVNDTTLALEAQKIGMKKTGATWDSAQKRQLSYNIIMRSTKAAQGDFARTSGGLANQTKIATAQFTDLQGQLGAVLLPTVVKVMGWFVKVGKWMQENPQKAKILAIAVGSVAGAVVALAVALKAYTFAQKIATMASAAFGAVNALIWSPILGPVLVVTAALVALGAVFVLLWKKSDTFRAIVTGAFNGVKAAASAVWNWIKANWPKLLLILTGPFGIAVVLIRKYGGDIKAAFSAVWSAIKSGASAMASWVVGKARSVVNFYTSIPGKLAGAGKVLFQHGIDLIQGFINGIVERAKDIPGVVKDKVVGVAKSALTLGGLFGSPSRLTMRYGRWWSEGFVIGIKAKEKDVIKAVTSMIEKLKAKVEKAKELAAGIKSAFLETANPTSLDMGAQTSFAAMRVLLEKQAKTAVEFARGITKLRKGGLNATTLDQLTQAGPGSLSSVQALLSGGRGGIGDVNRLVGQIGRAGAGLGRREAVARYGVGPDGSGRVSVRVGDQRVRVDLNFGSAADELTDAVVKALRKRIRASGGNVQAVLGKA